MSRVKLPLDKQRRISEAIREGQELMTDLQKAKEAGIDVDWQMRQLREQLDKFQRIHRDFCPDCQAGVE